MKEKEKEKKQASKVMVKEYHSAINTAIKYLALKTTIYFLTTDNAIISKRCSKCAEREREIYFTLHA